MSGIKASHAALSQDRLMREPVTALIGINTEMAEVLADLAIVTVFDLATARIFADAARVSFPQGQEATLRQHGLMPSALLDDGVEIPVDAGTLRLEFLQSLSKTAAGHLRRALGIETLRDLARWPPYLEARRQAGYDTPDEIGAAPDPEVPGELQPKFNEHATEKVFYSVYTIEAAAGGEASLRGAVSLDDLASKNAGDTARTGFVLRYEQSWTPVALALGNLLHSLTLAPGEATRVAVVDWTRKQGVSTRESIAQSEQLSNLQVNARSLSEITRAVAREAQNGFSSMNANSTVSNNAYTSYGVTNPNEALTAAVTGAGVGAATLGAAGGAAGAGLGGAAGALIGTGIGVAAGGVSVSYALPIGAAIGTVAGGLAGLGSGAIVGAGAGGAAGFAGAANFGADMSSESNTALDSVTTTMTNSTRDVESEMLQSVSDRTQQHASSARNRTASIVQEVSQSESESISTRVVTNYNHMFALTVQYYEVVQIYTQRTKLVRKQECVYIPVRPIERWTPELVRRFRKPLLDNALTPELSFGLIVSQGTVGLHSPRFSTIPIEELANLPSPQLHEARQDLDSFVGANPFNDWRVPEDGIVTEVWGFESHGGGPFGAHDAKTKGTLTAVLRDGERVDIVSPTEVELSLRNLASVEYEVRADPGSPSLRDRWDGDDPDPEARRYDTMRFVITTAESESRITFRAYYSYSKTDLGRGGRVLKLQILEVSKAWGMTRVLQHLNENTGWYSRQILRRRDPAIIRTLIDNYHYGDGVLAEVVDPDPVAINGMSLVFLLHEKDRERKPLLPELVSEEIVPVGTGGVFAEAVRGRANAAERLDMSRFWDWQDSPIPLTPPEITPVTAGSRAMASDLRPGSLDPSLIELRDPQALPAARGTAAVLSTLQTRLFEDVSGIMQTAQLAQTALQQTAQAATASGATVSETLQQGMDQTSRIIEKAAEMTGDYGKLLAEGGLDLARAGVGAAFGMAGSGLGGGALGASGGLPSSSAAPRRGSSAAGYQPAGRISNGSINLGENSTAGAVLNRARSIDVGGGTAGAPVSRSGTGTGTPVSLEHEILRGLGGLSSQSAGPQFAGPLTPAAVDLNDSDSRKSYIGNQVDDALEPLLARASDSDADFDAAYRRTITMMETAASIGESMDTVASKAAAALAEGWRASVLRNVEAFNGGDLSRTGRLAELVAVRDAGIALPVALVGDLDPVALLNYSIAITDVAGPENVVGGEEVTLIATVRESLPDGTERPAVAASVTVTGNPIVEDRVSTVSGNDGKAVFVVNHGVPPTGFEGIHRYAGYYNLDLNLSVQSALVPFSFDNRKFVVPGKIKVDLIAATDVNTGDNVLFGSVVAVTRGTHVNLQFRATVGGQPLQGHYLNAADVDVNGGGTLTGVTSVDSEGIFAVEYSTAGTTGSVAYVSPVVTLSEAHQQAGFAAIQIEG